MKSQNIGDDIQTIAYLQLLFDAACEHFDVVTWDLQNYDATTLTPATIAYVFAEKKASVAKSKNGDDTIVLVPCPVDRDSLTLINKHATETPRYMDHYGWHSASLRGQPRPSLGTIAGSCVSFHVSSTLKSALGASKNVAHFFRNFQPILCRDLGTARYLQRNRVDAHFVGCLTTALRPMCAKVMPRRVAFVDVPGRATESSNDVRKTHFSDEIGNMTASQRLNHAVELLTFYATCSKVVTSRLHAALPAMALGGKVEFCSPKGTKFKRGQSWGSPDRFGGLDTFILRQGDQPLRSVVDRLQTAWKMHFSQHFASVWKRPNLSLINATFSLSKTVQMLSTQCWLHDFLHLEHIYVLNLQSRPDRMAQFTSEMDKHGIFGYTRWLATEPKDFTNAQKSIAETLAKRIGQSVEQSARVYACLLSHCAIVDDAQKNDFKRILIFEDDVVCDFTADTLRNMIYQNRAHIRAAQLAYLGYREAPFSQQTALKGSSSCVDIKCGALHTSSYIVTASMYEQIQNFQHVATLPIDQFFAQKLQRMCKCVGMHLFKQRDGHSDIDGRFKKQT